MTTKYLITDGDWVFDSELKTWPEVMDHATDWSKDCQVFEVFVEGKRVVGLGADVTAQAERAAYRGPTWDEFEADRADARFHDGVMA